jgi:hypothetical protein
MDEAFTAGLEIVELKNVGHFPHRECPNLVNARILEFLGDSAAKATRRTKRSKSHEKQHDTNLSLFKE